MKSLTEHFSPAELKALRITSTFETDKPLDFGGLAGNFDDQGLSFGILQWNIKSGTLQPLLKEFISLSTTSFNSIFTKDSEKLKDLLLNKTLKEHIQFALSINDSKNRIIEPWKSYFAKLASDSDMQTIQIHAAKNRLRTAEKYMPKFGFLTERAFVFLFDIVTQHGPNWLKVKNRGKMIAARISRLSDEKAIMRVIAETLAITTRPTFANFVRARRNIIIEGRGKIGKRYFDMERDFGLGDDIIRS